MPIPILPLPGQAAEPAQLSSLPSSLDWGTPFTGQLDGADAYASLRLPRTPGTTPLTDIQSVEAGGQHFTGMTPLPENSGSLGQFPFTPPPMGKQVTEGNLDLNLLDPAAVMTQLTGPAIGRGPLIGQLGAPPGEGLGAWPKGMDPNAWLAQKDINPLGNIGSRMADYLFAPMAVLLKSAGGPDLTGTGTNDGNGFPLYAWQRDPNYYQAISGMSPTDLYGAATRIADQYHPGYQNAALATSLYQQMQTDQLKQRQLTSGNAGVDLTAKQQLQGIIAIANRYGVSVDAALQTMADNPATGGVQSFNGMTMPLLNLDPNAPQPSALAQDLNALRSGNLWSGINGVPILGDLVQHMAQPVPDDVEKLWNDLSVAQRGMLLGTAGQGVSGATMMAMVPAISGLGMVAALGGRVAAGTTAGRLLAGGYDVGKLALTRVVQAGIVSATATWAAEIAVPGTALGDFAKQIDLARPVSNSQAAGVINVLGYFVVTPAEMIAPFRGALRFGGRVAGAAVGGVNGLPDMAFYKYGIGGSNMEAALADRYAPGIVQAAPGLSTSSAQAEILSRGMNHLRDQWTQQIDQGVRDSSANPEADLTSLTPGQRQAWAQDQMNLVHAALPRVQEQVLSLFGAARKVLGPFATAADRTALRVVQDTARNFDDGLAQHAIAARNSEWSRRFLGADGMPAPFDAKAFRGWLDDQAARNPTWGINTDAMARDFGKDTERWLMAAEKLSGMEFMAKNGELQSHIEASLAANPRSDAGSLAMVRQDHIFADQRRDLIEMHDAQAPGWRAAARQLRMTTKEGQGWHAKNPEASDAAFVAWVKSLPDSGFLMERRALPSPDSPTTDMSLNAFHAKIDSERQWTLAYKPKYSGMTPAEMAANGIEAAAGAPEFVSYHTLPDGQVVQSPYLDYGGTAAAAIKLGNQHFLASQIDSVMRGWRTWRITEFQRANMFRRLSPYEGVTGPQIDAIHEGLLKMSSDNKYYNDTLKLTPQAMTINDLARKEIQELGERIVGTGEKLNRATGRYETIDWNKVVREAYVQGYKLNATAALTSNLRAHLPDPIAKGVMLVADVIVPEIRFGFSPLFNAQMRVESVVFNGTRGAAGVAHDPEAMATAASGGVGRQFGAAAAEISADPLAGSVAGTGAGRVRTGDLRFTGRPMPGEPPPPSDTLNRPPPPLDAPGGGGAPPYAEREPGPSYAPPPPRGEPPPPFTSADTRSLADKLRAMAADPNASPNERAMAQRHVDRMEGRVAAAESPVPLEAPPGPAGAIGPGASTPEPATQMASEPGPWLYHGASSLVRDSIEYSGLAEGSWLTTSLREAQGYSRGREGVIYRTKGAGEPVPPSDSQRLAAAGVPANRLEVSTDGGATFTPLAAPAPHPMPKGEAAPLDPALNRRDQILKAIDNIEKGIPAIDPDTGKPVIALTREHAIRFLERKMLGAADEVPGTTPPVARTTEPGPNGSPGVNFETTPGTGAHVVEVGRNWDLGNRFGKAWSKLWDASTPKEEAALHLQVRLLGDQLPAILRAARSPAVARLTALKVPETEWAKYLLDDRSLWQKWQDVRDPGSPEDKAAWETFVAHAGKYDGSNAEAAARGNAAAYQGPEWTALSTLWRMAVKNAQVDAFGVHFFSSYRSTLARTLNHPVLGSYPAAWSYKVAREWYRFMYDNHTIRGLNLGMTPAVAWAHIQQAQAATWAMTHNDTLDQELAKGPWGESIFMFNLLMPGTPDAIPFPLSRTLRLVARGDYNPVDWVNQSFFGNGKGGGMGAIRDLKAFSNVAGEFMNNVTGHPAGADAAQKRLDGLISSGTRSGVSINSPLTRAISSYPTKH